MLGVDVDEEPFVDEERQGEVQETSGKLDGLMDRFSMKKMDET